MAERIHISMPEPTNPENGNSPISARISPAEVSHGVDTSEEAQMQADAIASDIGKQYGERYRPQKKSLRRRVAPFIAGAAVVGTLAYAALRGGEAKNNTQNSNTPTPGTGEPSSVLPGGAPSIAEATATVRINTPTPASVSTPEPTVSPTEKPEATPTRVITPTAPAASATPDRVTPTPEQKETIPFEHKITFNGEKVGLGTQEFMVNPLLPDAEASLKKVAMEAHKRGFLANNPEKAATIDQSDPQWFEKLVAAGEASYTIKGHKKDTWEKDTETVEVVVNPQYGIQSEIRVDDDLLERPGNYIKGSIMFNVGRQAYMLVDERGALTTITVISSGAVSDPSVLPHIENRGIDGWVATSYLYPTYAALGNVSLLRGARGVTLSPTETKPFQNLLIPTLSPDTQIQKPYSFRDDYGNVRAPLVIFKR